jgi:DNA-binding CsgD family transcriptional regulator
VTAELLPQHLPGRTREAAELQASVDAARAGQLRVVLVSGELGIGKTRLLDHTAARAAREGVLVLRGSSYEDTVATSYTPFSELLGDLLRLRPASVDALAEPGARRLLAPIVPGIDSSSAEPQPGHLSATEQVQQLLDAVGRLLVAVAAREPLLLVLDDMHWADAPSCRLLRQLVRALRLSPAAIAVAYRDTDLEPDAPFQQLLVDLSRERATRRVQLRRLDRAGTQAVLEALLDEPQGRLPPVVADSIHRDSEGVPFFIEELVLQLREDGQLVRDHGGVWQLLAITAGSVPTSIRGVIGQRLGRLTAEARDLLALAAVIGRDFDLDVLARAADARNLATPAEAAELVEQALARRLLVERPALGTQAAGRPLGFAHEQIREVLYQGLSPIRRRALHQTVGEALEAGHQFDPAWAGRIASHFMRGDDLERAARYAVAAGSHAANVHAFAEAVQHYDDALDVLDLLPDAALPALPQRRFDILLQRDRMLEATGDTSRRLRGNADLMRVARATGNRQCELQAHLSAARLLVDLGRTDEARAQARTALELGRVEPGERVDALLALAETHTGRRVGEPSHLFGAAADLHAARDALEGAYRLAVEVRDERAAALIAQELGVVGSALAAADPAVDADTARGWLMRALEGFRLAGDRKGEVTALIALAYRRTVPSSDEAVTARDSYVSFLEEIRRLRATEHRLVRSSERPRMEALALLSIHLFARTNGWYEVALDRGTRALGWAQEARDERVALMARIGLSETERLLGRVARALEHAERAAAILRPGDGDARLSSQRDAVLQALAAAHLAAGSHDQGLRWARERVALAQAGGARATLADATTALAESLEIAGVRDEARSVADQTLRLVLELPGDISWDIRAELVLARDSLRRQDERLALGHATAARSRLVQRDLPLVWLATGAALAHGLALEAGGYADDARAAVADALALVRRSAERITDRALRDNYLRQGFLSREVLDAAARIGLDTITGATPGVAAPSGGGLTARETEVLRLVAAGMTNREISDTLFISEKTVARHLTNIFTKLDTQSRTQAAAWAFRNGLA